MKRNSQKGGIISGMLLFVAFIITATIGVQIIIAFVSQQTIKNAVKTVLIEERNNDEASSKTIVNSIKKKLSMNDIDLDYSNIYVEKNGRLFTVDVTYEKEIGLTNNFKLLMDLSFNEQSPQ